MSAPENPSPTDKGHLQTGHFVSGQISQLEFSMSRKSTKPDTRFQPEHPSQQNQPSHSELILNSGNFPRKLCDQTFENEGELSQRGNLHCQLILYWCSNCAVFFSDAQTLNVHSQHCQERGTRALPAALPPSSDICTTSTNTVNSSQETSGLHGEAGKAGVVFESVTGVRSEENGTLPNREGPELIKSSSPPSSQLSVNLLTKKSEADTGNEQSVKLKRSQTQKLCRRSTRIFNRVNLENDAESKQSYNNANGSKLPMQLQKPRILAQRQLQKPRILAQRQLQKPRTQRQRKKTNAVRSCSRFHHRATNEKVRCDTHEEPLAKVIQLHELETVTQTPGLENIAPRSVTGRFRKKRKIAIENCQNSRKCLEHHTEQHQQACVVKTLVCRKCQTPFRHQETLTQHAKRCTGIFSVRDYVVEYLRDTTPGAESKLCSHCGKLYKNQRTLRYHLLSLEQQHQQQTHQDHQQQYNNQDNKHVCMYCGKMFDRKKAIGRHIKNVHTFTSFSCSKCHRTFKYRASFMNHAKKPCLGPKTCQGPYQCTQCGMVFEKLMDLTEHMHFHSSCLRFQCEKCQKQFRHRQSLYNHKSKGCNTKKEKIADFRLTSPDSGSQITEKNNCQPVHHVSGCLKFGISAPRCNCETVQKCFESLPKCGMNETVPKHIRCETTTYSTETTTPSDCSDIMSFTYQEPMRTDYYSKTMANDLCVVEPSSYCKVTSSEYSNYYDMPVTVHYKSLPTRGYGDHSEPMVANGYSDFYEIVPADCHETVFGNENGETSISDYTQTMTGYIEDGQIYDYQESVAANDCSQKVTSETIPWSEYSETAPENCETNPFAYWSGIQFDAN